MVAVTVVLAKSTVSVGLNVTDSVWLLPTPSTVPRAGVYVKVPGTLAVALSCVADSAVP